MNCCLPYQFFFADVAIKDIEYTDDMKRQLGPYPKIAVLLWDPETQGYYATGGGPGVVVTFDGDRVHLDLGGPATGLVKIT